MGNEQNDPEIHNQIVKMMNEKPDNEWGNLCNNSGVEKCREYIALKSKVEAYVNVLKILVINVIICTMSIKMLIPLLIQKR